MAGEKPPHSSRILGWTIRKNICFMAHVVSSNWDCGWGTSNELPGWRCVGEA
jgi:hypothetical protein